MNIRIKYGKTPEGRFLSHLDLMRTWQRALLRAEIPIAYSQGFNPHPKISFGSALAVGVTSTGEYMDISLKNPISLKEIKYNLEKCLPIGLNIYDVVEIAENASSLMSIIDRAKYKVLVAVKEKITQDELQKVINNYLQQEKILIMRKSKKGLKEKDIRSGIIELTAEVTSDCKVIFELMVQTGSSGNVRPEEVIMSLIEKEISLDIERIIVHREGLYISGGRGLISPLSVTA